MNAKIVYVVELGVVLAALWFLFWEYREFRVDELRQRLFGIRDDLFAKAAKGAISFDSPAYGLTRTTLNGTIRFAHELGFTRLFLAAIFVQRSAPEMVKNYRHEVSTQLSALRGTESRKVIQTTMKQMDFAIIRHLVLTSPLVFTMFAFAVMRVLLAAPASRVQQAISDAASGRRPKRLVHSIEAEAHGAQLLDASFC